MTRFLCVSCEMSTVNNDRLWNENVVISMKPPQVTPFSSRDLEVASYFRQGVQNTELHSVPDIQAPSLSSHEGLWADIPYYIYPVWIYRILGYIATNCGEQTESAVSWFDCIW